MKKQPILCVAVVVFALLLFGISALFGGWYHPGWASRRAITIDNFSSLSSLSNFQVGLEIPCYHLMQGDFDDIRFTTEDGITEIPYWIEEYSPSSNAFVWVKVPSIPALGSTHIYLYYGNQNAMSESNGGAVFVYFDDFNDGDISDWTVIDGTWKAENLFLEQMELGNHKQILSPFSIDGPPMRYFIDAKINYLSNYLWSGVHIFLCANAYSISGYKYGFAGTNVNGSRIVKVENEGNTNLDSDPTINAGNSGFMWIKARIVFDPMLDYFRLQLTRPDNVRVDLEAYDSYFAPPYTLGAYVGAHIGIDDLRVRRYCDSEPSCTIGDEEKKIYKKVNSLVCSISPPISDQLVFRIVLAKTAMVSGHIYDCSGRKIATLVDRQYFTGGEHTISMNRGLNQLSNGVYYVRMRIDEQGGNSQVLNEKILLIR